MKKDRIFEDRFIPVVVEHELRVGVVTDPLSFFMYRFDGRALRQQHCDHSYSFRRGHKWCHKCYHQKTNKS